MERFAHCGWSSSRPGHIRSGNDKWKTDVATAMPVADCGNDNFPERLKACIPIDQRRFFILNRYFIHESFHQPDAKGQVERCVKQDQSDMRVDQPDGAEH